MTSKLLKGALEGSLRRPSRSQKREVQFFSFSCWTDYPHVKHRKCRSRHRQHHKVASHATALTGVHNSLEAGVDTIDYISDEDLKTMAARAVYYVPTIHVGVYVGLKILSARWIRRKEDHFSSEYAGREYHFCSEECKDALVPASYRPSS
jgi:hypothetical protein